MRVGILSSEHGAPRKVAWITAGPEGVSFGVARATGAGTTYRYLPDGTLLRINPAVKGSRSESEPIAKHQPLHEIKGLLHLHSFDVGPGERLTSFPFRRKYEPVYVKPLNGRVSFRLGLLEPGVPEALDTIKTREERHFRLFSGTKPWILLWNSAGFERADWRRTPSPPRRA
jgi:hypothetical protein